MLVWFCTVSEYAWPLTFIAQEGLWPSSSKVCCRAGPAAGGEQHEAGCRDNGPSPDFMVILVQDDPQCGAARWDAASSWTRWGTGHLPWEITPWPNPGPSLVPYVGFSFLKTQRKSLTDLTARCLCSAWCETPLLLWLQRTSLQSLLPRDAVTKLHQISKASRDLETFSNQQPPHHHPISSKNNDNNIKSYFMPRITEWFGLEWISEGHLVPTPLPLVEHLSLDLTRTLCCGLHVNPCLFF